MYANWRLCYLIGGIPLVYGIVLFFLMKETPHWYANAGRFDDAVKVLADIERVSLDTETKRDPSCLVVPPRPKKTTPSVLFSNKYIIGTCAIWSLYFVGQFCVYGMNAWLPAWFSGIGSSPSPSSSSLAGNSWQRVPEGNKQDPPGTASLIEPKRSSSLGCASALHVLTVRARPSPPPLQIVESSQRTAAFF